jgi:hypothetical protein
MNKSQKDKYHVLYNIHNVGLLHKCARGTFWGGNHCIIGIHVNNTVKPIDLKGREGGTGWEESIICGMKVHYEIVW